MLSIVCQSLFSNKATLNHVSRLSQEICLSLVGLALITMCTRSILLEIQARVSLVRRLCLPVRRRTIFHGGFLTDGIDDWSESSCFTNVEQNRYIFKMKNKWHHHRMLQTAQLTARLLTFGGWWWTSIGPSRCSRWTELRIWKGWLIVVPAVGPAVAIVMIGSIGRAWWSLPSVSM